MEDSDKNNPNPPPKEFSLFGQGASNKFRNTGEAASMLARIFEMQRDLKAQLEYIHEQGKHCHIDVNAFFSSNMANISQTDILDYQIKEQALKRHLDQAANEQSPLAAPPPPSGSVDKMTKERKSKMRGARNKWIPLQ